MVSAVLFITFFVLLVLNVPISVCLGLSSAAAILYSGTSLTIVATNIYSGISKFLLLAIPFFVLSGNIMAKAGISTRLIRFVDTCVGHRKGGIANVCIIVACFFGAISGSGPATVAALGAVLIPAMVERGGFSAAFSTALMATSSSIAIVIPPSIAFVVYASITGVSIGDMFMAGIIPGILMGLALVVVVMLEVRRNHVVPSTVEKASAKERWNAFKDAFWGFLMPVIILGGIYGGIFTPTEAAAVSRDVDRYHGVNINNPNAPYHSGLIDTVMDKLYPITMPYMPADRAYKVYTEEFLVDPKNGDFDTVGILYVITPSLERVEINRYFKEAPNGFAEIDEIEYVKRKMKVQWRDLLSSDFKRIEEVFGFELYDWQKKYLKGELDSFPNGRRNGKTFVTILKGLLLDEETFTITELKRGCTTNKRRSYVHDLLDIDNKLCTAGFTTNLIKGR